MQVSRFLLYPARAQAKAQVYKQHNSKSDEAYIPDKRVPKSIACARPNELIRNKLGPNGSNQASSDRKRLGPNEFGPN